MEQKSEKDVIQRKNTYFEWFSLVVVLLIGGTFFYMYGMPPFSMQNYGKLFVILTLFCVFVLLSQWYRYQNINRFTLIFTLFGLGGSIAFLSNNFFMLFYYNRYPYTLLMIIECLVAAGSLFTESGFFDEIFEDKKLVRWLSLKLLFLFFVNALYVLYAEYQSGPHSALLVVSNIISLFIYPRYVDQLMGKKKSSWAFKWKY